MRAYLLALGLGLATFCRGTLVLAANDPDQAGRESPLMLVTLLLPVVVVCFIFYILRNARKARSMVDTQFTRADEHMRFAEDHMKQLESKIDRLDERLSRMVELLTAIEQGQRRQGG